MSGRLFIFGTGAHARKVSHYAVVLGYKVAGFVDERADAASPLAGVPTIPVDSLGAPQQGDAMFVAIGRPEVRKRLMDEWAGRGWTFPALVHPSACVAPDAQLHPGVLVAAGAVIETETTVGRGAIVDIGALIDHECLVGEFCHVGPGEVMGPRAVRASPV